MRITNSVKKKDFAVFVRNFLFGVEDSLVSTVGLLSGITVTGVPSSTIITTGVILIFVEAFSMGVGSMLSEHSSEEYANHKRMPVRRSFIGAVIMFGSYFASGFIPLFPYLLLAPGAAVKVSVIVSILALFGLGFLSAKAFGVAPLRKGLQMLIIGGTAVVIGAVVGEFINLL